MTFFIFLTCAFQLTAILQYSHNVCPHQRSSVKIGWIFLSICKCKGCSYLLVSPLFLSQPPILNFLVQIWLPFWEIPQIPPIHHGNSSSPHPFSNELVLFLPDPLVIQTSISVYDTTILSVTFLNSCCGHRVYLLTCPLSWYFYQISHISLFFPLPLSPFYPTTRLANLLWWPNQSLFFSLLLLNHLIWCLLLTNLPKGWSLTILLLYVLSMISLYNHQLTFGLFHKIIIAAIFGQWNYTF